MTHFYTMELFLDVRCIESLNLKGFLIFMLQKS